MERYLLSFILLAFMAAHPFLSICSAAGVATEESRGLTFVETLLQGISGESPMPDRKPGAVLSVQDVVKNLGMPDETVIADDEYCLLGQLHRWCLSEQNLMVVLLGDNFSSTVDHEAGSRMIALRKCKDERESSFRGLWGINFGDPDKLVLEKLEAAAGKGSSMVLSKDPEEAPIHAFLYDSNIKHQYIARKGDIRYYFIINKKGLLEVIIISRFDVMKAC